MASELVVENGDDEDEEEITQTYGLLLMLKEAIEPRKLRECCYELGSLTQHRKCVFIMEEYHAHQLVLTMMDSHKLHSDNQLAGLSTLNSMMSASQKLLQLIEKQDIISTLKGVLEEYPIDPQIQAVAFRSISILARSGASRSILLSEGMTAIILDHMQQYQLCPDVSVQSSACLALKNILINDDNLQIEFVEQDHHKVFISLLSSHKDNPTVLVEALHLLAVLASQEEKYDFILQTCQYIIPVIMKAHPNDASLQIAACTFLNNLARTMDDQQLLIVKGIYPLVIHVLRCFHSEVQAQEIALQVLDKMAPAVLTASQWLGHQLEDRNWLVEVFNAMTFHPGSTKCQVLACKVLCHLLEGQPHILEKKTAGEEDSSHLAVDNAVLTGLRLYGETEKEVYIAAARAIYHLAVNSKILQEDLVLKGAHLDIQRGMTIYAEDAEAQGASCRAITGLCIANIDNKVKFAQMELHIQVFSSLRKHWEQRPFLDEAMRCITCLADVGVVCNQCMVEGIHELFMQAMVNTQDDAAFQELSLEAMSVLSSAEGMVDILCEAGLLRNTAHIMEKFDKCENIQQQGSILFQTLVANQKAYNDPHLSKQVAKAIITSMNKFQKDPNVLAESCVALQLMADNSEAVSRVLVECEVHSVLFMVLENYESNEVLVDLVCEVLYILCCRWDFKNEMIMWACKNNLNKGVEVLLQLGANINAGDGRDSPLCYACQNDNEKMVILILQQNVNDMQTALSLCLELELHHLVGLLLKYIGYDAEGSTVIWSNLSMGRLHARWFYPTFTRELARTSIASSLNLTSLDSLWPNQLASRILSKEAKREERNKKKHILNEQRKRRSSLSITLGEPYCDQNEANDNIQNDPSGPVTVTTATPLTAEEDDITEVDSREAVIQYSSLRRNNRSCSVSDIYAATRKSRRRLSSADLSSGLPPPLSLLALRKPSLTSAELPINPDDPRWLDAVEGGTHRRRLSSLDSTSGITRPTSFKASRRPSLSDLPTADEPAGTNSLGGGTSLKSFHMSTPNNSSLSPSEDANQTVTDYPPTPVNDACKRRIGESEGMDSLSPIQRSANIYPLSPADVSESSAWEEEAPPSDRLSNKDAFSSTPLLHRNSWSRSSRNRKNRLSSSSTIGSSDWLPFITHLNLSSNGVPSLEPLIVERPLLTQFQYLTKLDLSKNTLTEIPAEFLQFLQDLEVLDLSANQLTSFPAEIFGCCSKLRILNVSSNEIYSPLSSPEDSSKALVELDLSHNAIGQCPMWLSDYTPCLNILRLQSINLSSLPNVPLKLPHLTCLNLSYNNLVEIPLCFLEELSSLATLNISYNNLEHLPAAAPVSLSKLSILRLGNNALGPTVPSFVLSLPSLRCVDLSSNRVASCPPPYQWKTQTLKELNLSNNRIKELRLDKKFDLRNWKKLEKLLLSRNKLGKVPKELGKLTSLCTLDISHNKDITTIPDQLGTLSKLWEFPLDGLKLDLDPAIRKSRTKDIIGFLNQKLKKAVPYFRMKLMVVGYGGRGKSSLLARLRRDKPGKRRMSTATVGIDVGELKVTVMHNRRSETFHLTTWDIAGQEDFYSTHPCFLSGRALFLVVYDLNRGVDELQAIRNWLLTIKALAPFSPVIVIGTHKDKVIKESQAEKIRTIRDSIKNMCSLRGFPSVEAFAEVSCLHDDTDMERLRKLIVNAVERANIKGQPVVGQKIPYSYKLLEELFQEEAVRLKQAGRNPIMLQSEVLKKVKEKEITLTEEELVQAARFLHETGVILHYDDPALHLENLYFVQPEWLCKIMAQVITVKEINPFVGVDGVMRKSDIHHLIKTTVDQSNQFVETYINLLEKFEVALPISEVKLLIPSKVPSARPDIQLPPSTDLLHRYYKMPYTPIGLWPRLILRLLQFSTDMLRGEDTDHGVDKTSKYWKEGIYVHWSQEAFFVVASEKFEDVEAITIKVPTTTLGYRVLGQVCDHLDDLIEEWFPGLTEIDPTMGTELLQRVVRCVGCDALGNNEGSVMYFTLEELLDYAQRCDAIPCRHPENPVPIKLLAPDITFADFDESFQIDLKHLNISFTDVLGEGSFGSVYGARYKGRMVAVKMFSDKSDVHPHRMMRQEVTVLRHLQHPCLVSMEGVAYFPRILVMELAPLGSLGSLLNSEKGKLNRKLQHKIAMQIAEGLEFLHQNRIVYRDLKPDNILIFSLLPGDSQNVKISDYGISRFTTPYGLKASEGTPGYRAPEVIKGTSTYNTEVDMFSYGILLFELVTGGRRPFQDLDFRTEIEEAVVKGRGIPQITECGVPSWPDMQDLINNCTESVPQKRPTAAMALDRLQSADFICLRQTYAAGSINAVSMTVRKYRKNKDYIHEVWMTGGEGRSTMISLINPFSTNTKALVQGTIFEEGQGVCILAAGENTIIVGTQEGKLCVVEPTKEFSGPIALKHSINAGDAVLCLLHQARADNEGRVLAGLADGRLLVYDVYALRTDESATPVRDLTLDVTTTSPLSCMVQYKAKLYVGCGNHIALLNADSLEIEGTRFIKNHETNKRTPGPVRMIAVDKQLWVCRRDSEDSHFIEVWDPGKGTYKTSLDVATLLREYDPSLTLRECGIKAMMLQSKTALWVGLAGGHLALIDRHTSKLVTLIRRYTDALRTIFLVKSPESTPSSNIIITAGRGFIKRPGWAGQADEDCIHILVWDARLKDQVRYIQSEIDRRSRGDRTTLHKVQQTFRAVNAFHLML